MTHVVAEATVHVEHMVFQQVKGCSPYQTLIELKIARIMIKSVKVIKQI